MSFTIYTNRSILEPNFITKKDHDEKITYTDEEKEYYSAWLKHYLKKNYNTCIYGGRIIFTDSDSNFSLLLNHFARSYFVTIKKVKRRKFLFIYNNVFIDKSWVHFCDDAADWINNRNKK